MATQRNSDQADPEDEQLPDHCGGPSGQWRGPASSTALRVSGCGTCPVSTQTLKAGVERILRDRVPGVTEVLQVGAVEV